MPRVLLAAVTAVFTLSGSVSAVESARQILDRRKALDETTRHWDDRQQRMKLTIADHRGSERVRELDLYERKYPGDEQKAIVFLLAPAELKGTGFLGFTHRGRSADQWLYLPELKRVRQITADTRNESFIGTDFTYHDLDLLAEMPSWSEEDASSSVRGEEAIDGILCHVIELAAHREDIGYKHIVLWLGRDDLIPRQVEFNEQPPSRVATLLQTIRGGSDDAAPKKRVRQGEVHLVGAIPVAHRVTVETPAAGTQTKIEITDVKFNQGLDDDLFSKRHLELGGK